MTVFLAFCFEILFVRCPHSRKQGVRGRRRRAFATQSVGILLHGHLLGVGEGAGGEKGRYDSGCGAERGADALNAERSPGLKAGQCVVVGESEARHQFLWGNGTRSRAREASRQR